MPKWSDYIRNLGTAGPATIEGIKALGFTLASDIPALVAKYVRVDAAQAFTGGEQLQGRENIGLGTIATQDADAVTITGGFIEGIDPLAVADGGTGAGTSGDARTNLGLGNVDNTSDADKPVSTATQTALDDKLDVDGGNIGGSAGTLLTALGFSAFVQSLKSAVDAAAFRTGLGLGTAAVEAATSFARFTTSSTEVQSNLPVGSILTAYQLGIAPLLNAAVSPYQATGTNYANVSGSGTQYAGTWACRGRTGSDGSGQFFLVQRIS